MAARTATPAPAAAAPGPRKPPRLAAEPTRVHEDFRIVGNEPAERGNAIEFDLVGAGRRFSIFFRCSEVALQANREALLACALLPAMSAGVERKFSTRGTIALLATSALRASRYTCTSAPRKP